MPDPGLAEGKDKFAAFSATVVASGAFTYSSVFPGACSTYNFAHVDVNFTIGTGGTGEFVLETSYDGTNWFAAPLIDTSAPTLASGYYVVPSGPIVIQIPAGSSGLGVGSYRFELAKPYMRLGVRAGGVVANITATAVIARTLL